MNPSEPQPFGPPGRFYEGLRWHEDRWWVSDQHGRVVVSIGGDGEGRVELATDDKPSGLGWRPDGALIVASMDRRQLLRRAPGSGRSEVLADLAPLTAEHPGFLNDMWVTRDGHVYVGFDVDPFQSRAPEGLIVHVDPDGRAQVAARDLSFPNGIVVTPDGATLVVAETFRSRFTSYPIGEGGKLGEGSTWADLSAWGSPSLDGCVMDSEGCIWAADVRTGCLRVAPGGEVLSTIRLPEGLHPFACALGGPDNRQLMICAADLDVEGRMKRKGSQLYGVRVEAPGLGSA